MRPVGAGGASPASPAQREILDLHRFQGFDYAEIGQMLGCSEGAARVKAHRALEALRTLYFR
ncbi:sigma-70 region 4 domain-containing protein [Hymenobacter sp. 5516J-16]|uniref:RNA polymerase sigma factor n=1 Tax=Hymenobacter sp. 5516J-16 TaxID=2932253 RepID=UPI001FD408EF|nr:sigma-70 region 4 domain-containing protein [Hymenobacter sp. 5516J-16]UOQ78576.1 sigma-70 region 4 domain-containing protein [Hymenobacter sp. 5516J-16]